MGSRTGCFRIKLTETQVRFIRDVYVVGMAERRAQGFKYIKRGVRERLAQMFGVTPSMIKAIICRRRWRHLR